MKKVFLHILLVIVFYDGAGAQGTLNTKMTSLSDTLIFSTDTSFVAYPSMIYCSDSVMMFFDNLSENLFTYVGHNNQLAAINSLGEYIDRIQYPQGIYAIGALSQDSLYCFLYNSLFLIDLKNKTSVLTNSFFEFDGLAYTIDSYSYSKTYDPIGKNFFFSGFPALSISDKDYLNKRDVIVLNIQSNEGRIVGFPPPDNYIRGMNYNILEKPFLAFGNDVLYCAYPISNSIITYDVTNQNNGSINFEPSHVRISSDIVPGDAKKSQMMAYYYYIANSVTGLYFDNGKIFVLYKEADQNYRESGKAYKNLYLWAYDTKKGETVFDMELGFMNDNFSIADIRGDRIYLNYTDPESDVDNNFKFVVYEILY